MFRALLFLSAFCGAQTLVIEHANVIDATGGPVQADSTVTVRDGRIASVAKTAQTKIDGALVVDATGKFLIPGLWDMHVHITTPQVQFPLLVANGVTGVREMYSQVSIAAMRQWADLLDAPRVSVAGFIDGPQPRPGANWPDAFGIVDDETARAAVYLLAQRHPDLIKVYSGIPKQAFFAVAAQARALRIPFAGHVPEEVSPLDASNAGMRSQEHLNNILLAASSQEEMLRKERVNVMNDPKLSGQVRLRLLAWPKAEGLFDTYNPQKAAVLFQTLVKNGTFQTPTLAVLAGFAKPFDPGDPLVAFLPKAWTDAWDWRASPFLSDLSPEEYSELNQRMRALLDRYKKLVGDMRRAGVQFLAGTDTSPLNPVLPGWGLHEELALLVESGLTPMEALQAATLNPARYFGSRDGGTIEVGKVADLILLDANPLEDIHNTQNIHAVILRGHYYSREDLDGMLEKAMEAAR